MKKIQLVFAIVAVLAASVGVLGNAMMPPDTYFETTSSTDLNCNTQTFLTPCSTGTSARCVINASGTDFYINKKVGGSGDCVEHWRP